MTNMMKTIFITGASSGLGKATAKLFQSKGWRVIATMRDPKKETELNQLENITLLPLDVTKPTEIQSAVQKAIEEGVDVVFNNAGYGLIGPLEALSDEQITKQLDTNLLGIIRVTKAFIPYFREKGEGVLISTTSIGGLVSFPFGSTYHATKWALEGWSESMWFELGKLGINIKTVSPGAIKTDFIGRSLDFASLPAYESVISTMMSNTEQMMETASSPEQIAEVVYEAATDGKHQLRYVAGADAKEIYKKRQEVGDAAFMQYMNESFLQNKG
jgi:NAD(P)-dependent dehydrogenase (short-subunit alcohol dehydrogenase family)